MDINRVELKGRVATDVTVRKTATGGEWLAFAVATNEYNPAAAVEKDKSIATFIQVAVFNPNIVERIRKIGIRMGTHVWLLGKIIVRAVENHGRSIVYTSVAVSEIEVLQRKKSNFDLQAPNEHNNNDNDF